MANDQKGMWLIIKRGRWLSLAIVYSPLRTNEVYTDDDFAVGPGVAGSDRTSSCNTRPECVVVVRVDFVGS